MHPNNDTHRQQAGVGNLIAIKNKHLRILVIDDEDNFREALSDNLSEKYDAAVTDVASGGDAVELLESGRSYDLIFLDLMMPGMSGTETYERLRHIDANCSIVMMSAHADNDECRRAEALAGGVLSKPELAQTLAEILFRVARR